ncbi:MAG: Lrp/AsnC family transcriptional regulator [Candidatus Hodarchaeales archaeon]|jgi:Lrp/AsnC family leucine-responsive transcriptional regulator
MSDSLKKIDSKDRNIIKLLKEDPKLTHQQIANELGDRFGQKLSRQTVQKRIHKLEENDVIKYAVLANDKRLGKEITAFVLVEVNRTHRETGLHDGIISRKEELDLIEIHYVAGQEDILLKMRTENIDSFGTKLIKISGMEGVARTRTMISLYAVEQFVDTLPAPNFF